MNTTTNLELGMPEYPEAADVAVFNANMETIDTEVARRFIAPAVPALPGTYRLIATVAAGGAVTYSWVAN